MTVYDQMIIFAITMGLGVVIGITFDFYRAARGLWRPKMIATVIGDMLIWLFLTVITFAVLLVSNWGEVRFYVFIGIFAGALVYYRLFSSTVVNWWRVLLKLVARVTKLVVAILTFSFRLLPKLLFIPAVAASLGAYKLLRISRITGRAISVISKNAFKKIISLWRRTPPT